MGNFNEIQKGIPDLGKTYWQDIKKDEQEDNPLTSIVDLNCHTIFDSNNTSRKNKKSSIFE